MSDVLTTSFEVLNPRVLRVDLPYLLREQGRLDYYLVDKLMKDGFTDEEKEVLYKLLCCFTDSEGKQARISEKDCVVFKSIAAKLGFELSCDDGLNGFKKFLNSITDPMPTFGLYGNHEYIILDLLRRFGY